MRRHGLLRLALAIAPLATGCLPYTVASTARPIPAGQKSKTGTMYFIPNAVEDSANEGRAVPMRGFDTEARWGIDERSDWGFRLTSFSGATASYKRLLTDPRAGTAVAVEGTGGFVNFGEHALVGASLLASGRESNRVTPYAGLRAMQVVPMSSSAVHDTPTIGAIVGARFGRRQHGISPELGIFYDRSALDLRKGALLLVPSISVHGEELMQILGRAGRIF